MEDSVLKKEFKKSDVERIRNIVSKKYNNSTKTQVGYQADTSDYHKEGDVWTENDKTWTIKNGVKRNVTKFENIKKETSIPMFCPECESLMHLPFDIRSYIVNKKCYDCQTVFETELKRVGKYEEYQKSLVKNDVIAYIQDMETKFQEYVNTNLTFMSEQGDAESWKGNINIEQVTKEFNDWVSSIKSQFDIV
jgi:hypothetical protein